MSRLVFQPLVIPISVTAIDPNQIIDWMFEHGLDNVFANEDSPLRKLYEAASDTKKHAQLLPEFAGRFCYRSWDKGRGHEEYIENIVESRHGSVTEHSNITFAISGVSRSFSMELNRHRAGVAISQESQRYVDAKDIRFVVPPLMRGMLIEHADQRDGIETLCEFFVNQYKALQESLEAQAKEYGYTGHELRKRVNEAARCVLPNMAETRMVWTANLRTLRHVCELRGGDGADLEISDFAERLTLIMKALAPDVFAYFDITTSGHRYIPGVVSAKHSKV